MLGKIGAFLIIAILALGLAACGGKKAQEPEPVTAPATADAPETAAQDEKVCLYLFWSHAPETSQQLLATVQAGQKFPLAAREEMRSLPQGAARLNATCMPAKELDPLLTQQLDGLDIGQTSQLFDYQDGTALVMRTTDRFWRRGAELYEKGDYAQAEASLRRHLELHPDATTVWQALSEALAAQGKNEPALEALNQALIYSPENPAILNDQATLLARMGRNSEALALYEKALSLAPKSPLLMHNLAWALLEQNQELGRAQKLAEQAARLEPQEPRFWDTLGRIQKARGEYVEAVISLHRASGLGAKNQGNQQDLTDALLALPPEVVARLSQRPEAPAPPARAKTAKLDKPKPSQSKDPMGAGAEPLPKPVAAAPAPAAKAQAAPAVSSEAPPLPAPQPFVPGYYILVGSFRTAELAGGAMRKWRGRGQAVWMEWKEVPHKGEWVRVMLGPYQKRAAAQQDARTFRERGYINSYRILEK